MISNDESGESSYPPLELPNSGEESERHQVEYNDGYECRVYDARGNLKRIIPHNPRPVRKMDRVTEEDLDRIINGYTRESKGKVKQRNDT